MIFENILIKSILLLLKSTKNSLPFQLILNMLYTIYFPTVLSKTKLPYWGKEKEIPFIMRQGTCAWVNAEEKDGNKR